MAHSWVQMFDSEYEAFKAYCEIYPDNATLLVDTYNVLKSGVPNAIRAFNEVLQPRGHHEVRHPARLRRHDLPDEEGAQNARRGRAGRAARSACSNCAGRISHPGPAASGRADRPVRRGRAAHHRRAASRCSAACTSWPPSRTRTGNIIPKIKISENVGKITNPHFKKVYRFYGNDTGKAIADYLCLHDEIVDDSQDLEIFDPEATWKRKNIYNFTAQRAARADLQERRAGLRAADARRRSSTYCAEQVDTLWDEVKRFDNPHTYYVDLSQKLWEIKYRLLKDNACGEHHA